MSISSRYVIRETGANLSRNLVMTVAAVVTMLVSLAAAGGVLIMRQAIHTETLQFSGGVQIAVFMNPNATSSELHAESELLSSDTTLVKRFHFVDKLEAYQEAKKILGGDPALLHVLTPSTMPTSYRVVPVRTEDVDAIAGISRRQPGVIEVAYAAQEIAALQNRFNSLSSIALVLAVGVMIGAVALIVNTIQLAIFARRREVAVMKLVGATNWFIRIPFMLEGLVDGVVGALLACIVVYLARNPIARFVGSDSPLQPTLYVTGHDALLTGVVMIVVGALVGALGSAFAVRRFLRV